MRYRFCYHIVLRTNAAVSDVPFATASKAEEHRDANGLHPLCLGLIAVIVVTCLYKETYSSTLTMEAACSSETSVSTHRPARYHNADIRMCDVSVFGATAVFLFMFIVSETA